ncbi:MAG TPA: DUF1501 domain-containing protein [Bryobacteraceae bacterium]|nr:DUF1501 domain-containing protein [Bryobacteraceae bacterium]
MDKDQKKFHQFLKTNPQAVRPGMFRRPDWTRRNFFRVFGAGLVASCFAKEARAQSGTCTSQQVTTLNTARNVIFVLMAGAPSPWDTFDYKPNAATPSQIAAETVNGLQWPTGILPNIGTHLGDIAIIRSLQAHALVHSLGQTWVQIGRNPAAALGNIAPNIGSIVALEKAAERKPSDVLPTFLALNSDGGVGQGYLNATYAPFKYDPTTSGLPDTTNSFGSARWGEMLDVLYSIDGPLRNNSPLGQAADDMNNFYQSAQQMMYNPTVNQVFQYSSSDSARYGGSSFGNALIIAKQALSANMGTRFIQVTVGGWDMHVNIYGPNGNIASGTNIFTLGKQFDSAMGALLGDLKSSGLLQETLVIAMGEFGRTPQITAANGRDHYVNQFAMLAGGGVKGGTVLGTTDSTGANIVDPGWSQGRPVNPEDIEATIYSAMGINWTNVCYNDPFHRGFEYVPQSNGPNYWVPVNELFG